MKDQRVEPPDYNEYGKCDFCQDEFHIDDLHELDRLKEIYICYQCDGEREGKSDEELLQEAGGLTTVAPDLCPRCGSKMTGVNKGVCGNVRCDYIRTSR